jgi:hypothetical protein
LAIYLFLELRLQIWFQKYSISPNALNFYILQPLGFVESGKQHLVCHLHKALYGLKQAPRAWHAKIDSFLKEQGFTKAEADGNLYVICNADKILILILSVDDLLFTGNITN